MTLRPVDFSDPGDVACVLAGARKFASSTALLDMMPSDDTFDSTMLGMLQQPHIDVFAYDDGGRLVAGVGLMFAPFVWNPHALVAEEIFWWADEDAPPEAGMQLLRRAVEYASEVCSGSGDGGMIVLRALPTSPDRLDKIYNRMGFAPLERSFMHKVVA